MPELARKSVERRHSGATLEQVAKELGVSRQRVQQIERQALDKLRRAFGSTYRGKWFIFDFEGVPEAAGEPQDRRAITARTARRKDGRFVRTK